MKGGNEKRKLFTHRYLKRQSREIKSGLLFAFDDGS